MANLAVQVWVRKLGSPCVDGMESALFILSVGCTWTLSCRGRRLRRPAKRLKETFLLSYFCVTKSTKSHQRERSPLFENSPCRLAATGANKVPRPSRYSITMATGSKRSSADSDSLLCHVGLWRTSRFRFGCASVCEHSEIRVILIVPSAHKLHPRCPVSATPTHMLRICVNPRPPIYAGVQTMRARICSVLSCDMFARVVV